MKKTSFRSPLRLSLSCKKIGTALLVMVGCLLSFSDAWAINMAAIYRSACQREVGVIIDADDSKIRLLTLSGKVRNIERFNIIYMAYYPVGQIPVSQVNSAGDVDVTIIRTIFKDDVVDLVKGWMVDAADDRISFLTVSGTETVVDQEDIWDIDLVPLLKNARFETDDQKKYQFVHPYPFMHCNNQTESAGNAHLIYPQHLLGDPILIKKELDRLTEGYERLKGFHADKVFYARPQVYGNDARLGLWAVFGSRYGGTRNRNNNLIPEIVSEYSAGPFGFQHIVVTGNALMPQGVHEEPQMHFFYGLKADYVHFAIMVDFNRYVIGESKYQWHADDLMENDHRVNDTLNVSGGFDYGNFAIDFSIWNRIQYGVRVGNQFHENSINLNKGGFVFENRSLKAELYYGFGDDKKEDSIPIPDNANEWEIAYIEAYNAHLAEQPEFFTDYFFSRLNLTFSGFSPFKPKYSLIYSEIEFHRKANPEGQGEFRYKGVSLTNSLYVMFPLDDEIALSGFFSIEMLENRYGFTGLDESASHLFPKGGINLALIF